MSWQKHHLHFRLLSPLHIGWRKTGNLMQTRGYVPARNLWAALTARLTRDFDNGSNAQRYQEIGELVKKHFRFTYFYPALKDSNYKPHYPWQEDFDYLFLDSYAATALNYQAQAAEEAMLRETEFIAPRTRDDQQVYLAGSVYVQTAPPLPDPLNNWQQALTQLQIGGEQGYGWGRLNWLNKESCSSCGEPIEANEPSAKLVEGRIDDESVKRLAAHLLATGITGVEGEIEPLAGWERNNLGVGSPWQLRQEVPICYAPGATLKDDTQTFVIGEDGYWHPA